MIQIKNLFSIFILFSCLSFQDSPCAAAEASLDLEARKFVEKTGQKILDILQNKEIETQKKEDAFRAVLRERFDLKAIGFFALGRYRRQATKEEQDAFLKVFEDVIVESYASQFPHYSNEHLEITDVKGPDRKGGFLVVSQVMRERGKPLSVHWKVFSTKSGWKVLDLVIVGVSQSLTHRKEYAEMINRSRKGVPGLIKDLEKQVENYNKSEPNSKPQEPLSWKAIKQKSLEK
ncbi:MAG: ABC transporter substrate-binding protein [bacterium]|nr:ABC transporter substrate-binding protein [bacterium]